MSKYLVIFLLISQTFAIFFNKKPTAEEIAIKKLENKLQIIEKELPDILNKISDQKKELESNQKLVEEYKQKIQILTEQPTITQKIKNKKAKKEYLLKQIREISEENKLLNQKINGVKEENDKVLEEIKNVLAETFMVPPKESTVVPPRETIVVPPRETIAEPPRETIAEPPLETIAEPPQGSNMETIVVPTQAATIRSDVEREKSVYDSSPFMPELMKQLAHYNYKIESRKKAIEAKKTEKEKLHEQGIQYKEMQSLIAAKEAEAKRLKKIKKQLKEEKQVAATQAEVLAKMAEAENLKLIKKQIKKETEAERQNIWGTQMQPLNNPIVPGRVYMQQSGYNNRIPLLIPAQITVPRQATL